MPTDSQSNPLAELASIYISRGAAYADEGMWDRALLWYERAASYAPEDPFYTSLLAQAYEIAGRFPEAISAACEVVHLDFVLRELDGAPAGHPTYGALGGQLPLRLALAIIGRSCRTLGDAHGAVRAWTALLNLDPSNEEAWRGLLDAGSSLVRTAGAESAWEAMYGSYLAEPTNLQASAALEDSSNHAVLCPVCGRGE